MDSKFISTEHLLLALVQSELGLAKEGHCQLGITPAQIRRQVKRVLNENKNALANASVRKGKSAAPLKEKKQEGKDASG